MKPTSLQFLIQSFFTHRHQQHGLSSLTRLSYRDTLKLLLQYASKIKKEPVTKLKIEKLTPEFVISFLEYLETERGNQISTRNNRLAAIRSFFAYVAFKEPLYADQCRQICALPLKKAPTRNIDYLELNKMQALLNAPDQNYAAGRRDYALWLFLYNTGARVQELVGVKAEDISLEKPRQVLLRGKGNKERMCPLWQETVNVLKRLMVEEGIEVSSTKQIFLNQHKQPLTRFGVGHLIKKYGQIVAEQVPSLARKRLSPHTIRHYVEC